METDTPRPLRVVLADDHPMLLDGLCLALETPDTTVVATATTADEATRAVRETEPDVLVLDIRLPDASGIDTAAALREAHPQVAVLILTMSEDPLTLHAAMRAGAAGYLVKGASRAEILRAVRAVADGQLIFSAQIARTALRELRPVSGHDTQPFPQLTAREHTVLAHLADGLGNPAIARSLGVSPKTVANHVSALLGKLGLADRSQAALLARSRGLTS